jgi:hypothetical protein
MQGNWAVLVLLIVAVVVYALVKSRQKPEDEEGADETAESPDGLPPRQEGSDAPGPSLEPEYSEMSFEEYQRQLKEAPPLQECNRVFQPMEEDGSDPDIVPEAEVEPVPETEVEPVPQAWYENREISQEARQLFQANFWRILLLYNFVAELIFLQRFIPADHSESSFMIRLLLNLFTWLILLGMHHASVRAVKGDPLRLGMLVYYLSASRLLPALGLTLMQAAFVFALFAVQGCFLYLAAQWFPPLMAICASPVGWLLGVLLSIAAFIWYMVLITMMNFALTLAPDRGAVAAFKAGFHVGNRSFGRILTVIGWPFIVVTLIPLLLESSIIPGATVRFQSLAGVSILLYLALIFFYGGYYMLLMASLASRLLENADDGTSKR